MSGFGTRYRVQQIRSGDMTLDSADKPALGGEPRNLRAKVRFWRRFAVMLMALQAIELVAAVFGRG